MYINRPFCPGNNRPAPSSSSSSTTPETERLISVWNHQESFRQTSARFSSLPSFRPEDLFFLSFLFFFLSFLLSYDSVFTNILFSPPKVLKAHLPCVTWSCGLQTFCFLFSPTTFFPSPFFPPFFFFFQHYLPYLIPSHNFFSQSHRIVPFELFCSFTIVFSPSAECSCLSSIDGPSIVTLNLVLIYVVNSPETLARARQVSKYFYFAN